MSRFVLYPALVITILVAACSDSDKKPTDSGGTSPSISVGDQTVIEGNTVLFTVSIDRATDHRVTFSYATIDATAHAGSDYTAASGSDTIPIGQTSATVLVPTVDDAEVEGVETFSFILSAVAGAQVARALATATINDNDVSQVSFAAQVRPLLRTSCAKLGSCHGGSFPGGGMFLDTSASYINVINAAGINTGGKVVQPGNSALSTLYTKTTDTPPFPSRMPQDGPPYLSLAQQQLIRDWIDQGALDN